MPSNPTLKAEITAEDKGASATIASLGKSFDNLGKQLDSVNGQLRSNASNNGSLTSKTATLGGEAEKAGTSFRSMTSSIALGGVAALAMHTALGMLENATKSAISSAGDFEQYRVGFETMLGSADAAKTMLSDLSQFAATTPFTLPGLVQSTQQMLAMGVGANEVLPDIKMLGDVAAGVGSQKLPEISLAFSQVATKGHLAGQEIMQFANAGVPIIDELSKSLGKSTAEITKLSESGQISFGKVRQAFEAMTGPGGRFFDLMEKQSTTFNGTVSNIQDQMGRLTRQILGISEDGEIQAGGPFAHLKQGAVAFMDFITNNANKIAAAFQDIMAIGIDVFKGIKAALDFVGPSFLIAVAGAITFGFALVGIVKVVTGVIAIMRALVLFGLGPLGLAITVISILAGVVLGKAFDDMSKKMKGATGNGGNLAKALGVDVKDGTQAAAGGIDKLGEQLADLDDQMRKSTRDYQQQMAQMVKSTQDQVKSLKGQLNDEASSFSDTQDTEAAAHADKVQTIQDQIDKETQMGILADQTKLSNLQRELDKENNAYVAQTAKQKAAHDKKMSDLQTQYDEETQLLQKHADDVKSVQDVSILDSFQALEQSNADQMVQYEKQKEKIVENAGATGTDAAAKLASTFDATTVGANMGSQLGSAMGKEFLKAIGNILAQVGEELGRFIETILRTLSIENIPNLIKNKGNILSSFEDNWNKAIIGGSKIASGHAIGGNVQAGQIYPVGEQGIEYFTPAVNGRITPNNKINSMSGGSPVNITINAGAFMGTQIDARKYATMIMGAYQDAMSMKGQSA